jgi:hypothetical protein
VTYGPCPMPGTEETIEDVKKRKVDTIGKNMKKCSKATGKKKVEATKATPSQGKGSLKQPFAAEVASARPLKQSKKAMSHPAAVATTTCVPAGALNSKVATSAFASKGAASAMKTPMPIHKHRVPAIGAMAAVSSEEFLELSSHSQGT